MSVTVRILRADGAIINEVDFTSTGEDCICVDRAGIYRFRSLTETCEVASLATRVATLEDRVACLEARISEGAEARGVKPEMRDTAGSLVDRARARWLEARADRLEKDTAFEYPRTADPGPLTAHSVSVDSEQRRPGERVLWIGFSDGAGRDIVVALPFALALKLNGSIGRVVAERLDAAGER